MSLPTQAADAMVTLLNAATFDAEFTAVRTFVSDRKLEDLSTLRVDVVPSSIETVATSRSKCEHDLSILISVKKKFSADTPAAADEIDTLADAIREFTQHKNLAGEFSWYKSSRDGFRDVEAFETEGVFSSYIRVHYKAWS